MITLITLSGIHKCDTRAPEAAKTAQKTITKGKEVTVERGLNKKAPTKAPNFPAAAAMPPKVALISFGNVSEGKMKVVSMGPPLREKSRRQ